MQTTLRAASAAFFALGTAGLAAAAPAPVVGAGDGWYADYDEALSHARETGKPMIVDFTGSDWCGWCIRLDEEVFSTDVFKAAADQYVLCALDFPNGEEAKAAVPNPERNEELSEEFGIQGFPTILVLTSEGELLARTGYQAGGPEAYLEHLETIQAEGRADLESFKKMVAAYEAAPEEGKLAALTALVETYVEKSESAPARVLVPYVIRAAKLEGEANKGLRTQSLKALLKFGGATDEMVATAKAMDPQNEHGLLELCIMRDMQSVSDLEQLQPLVDRMVALLETGNVHETSVVTEMCVNCAFWCSQHLDDPANARMFAKKAKELGIDDPRMEQFVDQILSELGEEAPAEEPEPAPEG